MVYSIEIYIAAKCRYGEGFPAGVDGGGNSIEVGHESYVLLLCTELIVHIA